MNDISHQRCSAKRFMVMNKKYLEINSVHPSIQIEYGSKWIASRMFLYPDQIREVILTILFFR